MALVQPGERSQSDESAFEFPNVCLDVGRQVGNHVFWDVDSFEVGLLFQDCDASFVFRTLNVGDETPLESTFEPFFECRNFVGKLVGRYHDLSPGFEEIVEDMKKFSLGTVLACDELNVVDEEDLAVLSIFATKVIRSIESEMIDIIDHKLLTGDIDDVPGGVFFNDGVSDCRKEVGLTETDRSINEKGIVGGPWKFGDSTARGFCKLIGRPNHEILKGVFSIERGGLRRLICCVRAVLFCHRR